MRNYKSMKVKPIKDLVLLEGIKTEEVSVLTMITKPVMKNSGQVIAVGPDVKQVNVGDKVIFQDYGRILIDVEDRDGGFLIRENDVIGIIEE